MTRTQGYTYELLERRGEGHTDFVGVQSWDSFAPALAAWHAERNWLVYKDLFIPRRRLVRMAESDVSWIACSDPEHPDCLECLEMAQACARETRARGGEVRGACTVFGLMAFLGRRRRRAA